MRRLEITTKLVAIILTLSVVLKVIAVTRGERDVALFWSLGITLVLLVFSIIWLRAVVARKPESITLTVVFMTLPVIAAVAQIASVWNADESLVFKGWVTLCLIGVTGIYVRFAARCRRELSKELKSALHSDMTQKTQR